MSTAKEVTILVAVLNKAGTIRTCIESLLKLKEAPAKIMFVDGYSNDGTYEILKEYEGKIDLYQYPKNLSATFNWALDKIDTEYTALTDGDCAVASNWLEELLKGFGEENVVATAGYCGTPEGVSLLQRMIGLELEGRFKKLPKYLLRAPTMNLCLKTEVAKKVRFDERQLVGVEVDFGWRLARLGKIVYLAEAKIFHYHRAALKSYFLQQKNQAKCGVRLLFKHGRKATGDPITTLSMTAQIPLFFLGLIFALLSFFVELFLYPSIIFFSVLFIIYLKNIIEINPKLRYYPVFFGLFFLRTFAWAAGIAEGLIRY
jgi:glycosyltransferase involved in cell wall biosynthesis